MVISIVVSPLKEALSPCSAQRRRVWM